MTQFDYESILSRLKDNLSKRLESSGILFHSTNQRLLEAVAEELAEDMQYDEYLTNEAKWSTAQNISSLMAQTEFFNYKAHRKIGAKGELTVSSSKTFNGTWSHQIEIPKFSQFYNGTYYFTSYEAATLFSTNASVSVPVVEGVVITESFATTMYTDLQLTSYTIAIDDDSIENSVFQVTVNNVVWTKVDSFSEADDETSTIYVVDTNNDFSGITITFGDGVSSKKIMSGDEIEVTYVQTNGKDGEVLQSDSVTQVISEFTDASGSVVTLYCTNESYITGGEDDEDIESIRLNAPLAFRTGNNLATKQDYYTAILATGLPDMLNVWGEAEQNIDNNNPMGTFISLTENVIYVSGLTISEATGEITNLTSAQEDYIQEQIVDYKSLTDIVTFVDPKMTYFDINTVIYYDSTSYSADTLVTKIKSDLLKKYSISNSERTFKENLYFSQYYSYISSITDIMHHETDITLFQIANFTDNTSAIFNIELDFETIRPNSFNIYIRSTSSTISDSHPYSSANGWYLVASDDGEGTFTSQTIPEYEGIPNQGESFNVHPINPLSTFSYDTGSFSDSEGNLESIALSGIPNDLLSSIELKLEFKTGTTRVDIIPLKRYQVFGVNNVNVTAQGIYKE